MSRPTMAHGWSTHFFLTKTHPVRVYATPNLLKSTHAALTNQQGIAFITRIDSSYFIVVLDTEEVRRSFTEDVSMGNDTMIVLHRFQVEQESCAAEFFLAIIAYDKNKQLWVVSLASN